jgi:hypothetical protein
MKVKRLYAIAVLLATAYPIGSVQCVQAESQVGASQTDKWTPNTDDVRTKRVSARRDLMMNSLKGIRGLAYGAIHADGSAQLEKTMVQKLKQLEIPLHPFSTLKQGAKPIDGLLEVKISKVPNANYVQLNLIQWVSLLRQPRTEVRAVTYHDATLSDDADLNRAVDQLTEQFVVDVLKANQHNLVTNPEKAPVHKRR